jgi:50S ribosomal protein L16 3-hydroxylase
VDSYDMFLVQGFGRRRWSIARRSDPALRPGLALRVLRRFRPERSFVLEPGDLLYRRGADGGTVRPGRAHRPAGFGAPRSGTRSPNW